MLEEVSYLSVRNSQLEEQTTCVPQLQEEVSSSKKQIELLLVMLGEKEEELECLITDMKEVKLMYKSHMEELLEKVTSTQSNGESKSSPPNGGSPHLQKVTAYKNTYSVDGSTTPVTPTVSRSSIDDEDYTDEPLATSLGALVDSNSTPISGSSYASLMSKNNSRTNSPINLPANNKSRQSPGTIPGMSKS